MGEEYCGLVSFSKNVKEKDYDVSVNITVTHQGESLELAAACTKKILEQATGVLFGQIKE